MYNNYKEWASEASSLLLHLQETPDLQLMIGMHIYYYDKFLKIYSLKLC